MFPRKYLKRASVTSKYAQMFPKQAPWHITSYEYTRLRSSIHETNLVSVNGGDWL